MKVDKMIKKFTREGNRKLNKEYRGTREAIVQIAREKVQEFMRTGDVGLAKEERRILELIIAGGMMQSFSLGYGLGKVEGLTDTQIYL